MNEIAKCPVCQKGEMSLPSPTWAIGCSKCHFRCHAIQFKQIAAAMELARATVALDSADAGNHVAVVAATDTFVEAEHRVLEVFVK